jgi:hypothetical protein
LLFSLENLGFVGSTGNGSVVLIWVHWSTLSSSDKPSLFSFKKP